MGVKEVTVYAFSIENLKRPENEKAVIFRMWKNFLDKVIENE